MMLVIGLDDTDILMDENGQPVAGGDGETAINSDDEWLQDLKNEAMTEEGELFYEDDDGDDAYGFGLLEFMQGEFDDFLVLEIQQRVKSKMSKRNYIDIGSISTEVSYDGHNYNIFTSFKRLDSDDIYNFEIKSNGVEVTIE